MINITFTHNLSSFPHYFTQHTISEKFIHSKPPQYSLSIIITLPMTINLKMKHLYYLKLEDDLDSSQTNDIASPIDSDFDSFFLNSSQIGRASCRERVEIQVRSESL